MESQNVIAKRSVLFASGLGRFHLRHERDLKGTRVYLSLSLSSLSSNEEERRREGFDFGDFRRFLFCPDAALGFCFGFYFMTAGYFYFGDFFKKFHMNCIFFFFKGCSASLRAHYSRPPPLESVRPLLRQVAAWRELEVKKHVVLTIHVVPPIRF